MTIYSKQLLSQELNKLYEMEKSGQVFKLKKDFPEVYLACIKLHGSVEEALHYSEIPMYNIGFINLKWNYKWIEKGLLFLLEKEKRGERISFNKDYQKLKQACRRNFKTVENAAKFFNLDKELQFIRGANKWAENPHKILLALNDLYTEYPDGYKDIYSKEKAIVRASENHFGSLKLAIEKAGIPPDWLNSRSTRSTLAMSREDIISALEKLFIFDKLNITEARLKMPSLFSTIKNHFDSINDALNEIGIKYEDVLVKNERNAGKLAEAKVVEAIFNELGIKFSKGYNNELRPDFVLKHYWADAKLNYGDKQGWRRSIKKYKNHTKLLLIIYIFGPYNGLQRFAPKVLCVHINYYIKQLPKFRQIYYREIIEEIRQFYLQQEKNYEDILSKNPDIKIDKSLGKVTVFNDTLSFSIETETWQQSLDKILHLPLEDILSS